MVGSATLASIPQKTVVHTTAGAEGLFLFVEVRLERCLLLHRLFHDRLSGTDLIVGSAASSGGGAEQEPA